MPGHGTTCILQDFNLLLATQGADLFPEASVQLGGLMDYLPTIRRSRRVLFVACGTSYHACLATRQTIEQLPSLPVRPLATL